MSPHVAIEYDKLVDLCRRWQVAELALFGSVLRDDFDPERSDVDILVQFLPEARIGLFALSRMKDELSEIFGRKVDLVPKGGLKPAIRDDVVKNAQVVYVNAA
jgi:hypothetical protein